MREIKDNQDMLFRNEVRWIEHSEHFQIFEKKKNYQEQFVLLTG